MTESELYKELGALTKDRARWEAEIPHVSSLLADGSAKIRAKALWLLGEMGLMFPASVGDTVPRIAAFLDSADPLLRERAVIALGRIGRAGFRRIETYWHGLFRFARDNAPNVRLGFIWASENIASNTPGPYGDFMPVFAELLHDSEERVRMEAPEIFRVLGKRRPEFVIPYFGQLRRMSETDINRVVRLHCSGAVKAALTASGLKQTSTGMDDAPDSPPPGFVHLAAIIPEAIQDVRYYSAFNFIGERIRGYERPSLLLTIEAANELKSVSDELMRQGFRLKVYDAYRPQRAVDQFVEWSEDADDTRMKQYFYPDLDKSLLFPRGYLAARSGHSRGSTVDLTLFDLNKGKDVDMGGTFDLFGQESHSDWCGDPGTMKYTGGFPGSTPPAGRMINEVQFRNRMMLRSAMLKHGFRPVAEEWWHFTLADEPYPDTYFDHPVR